MRNLFPHFPVIVDSKAKTERSNPMEDTVIIDLYFRRDENAIKETAAKYGRLLLKIANNILCSSPDSEECVNDTYLKTWNSIPPNEPESLRSFTAKITRNNAINMLEKKYTLKRGQGQMNAVLDELEECIPSDKTVEESVDERALTELLNKFLRELPKKSRVIFIKKYWGLDSVKDIAAQLKISESSVKVTLFRAREKLKKLLTAEGVNL